MNAQYKTVLLTILTLSCLAIALVELSGVSSTALFNKYGIGKGGHQDLEKQRQEEDARMKHAATLPKTKISFIDTLHNFGTIKDGTVAKHAFRFKNTGNAPLFIVKALASCGCTVPSIPKAPIAPGEENEIMVEFNSHNRKGHNHKNILVFSNAEQDRVSVSFDVDVQ